MKILLILIIAFKVSQNVIGMEITPPYMVLRQIIEDSTKKELSQEIDFKKIRKNNKKHTETYVKNLLITLKKANLKIKEPENDLELIVNIHVPRKIDFIFEERITKWVDGSDFSYYILIGIKETPAHKRKKLKKQK